MNKQFWKGKTVLLTGHTGFKGSWLSLWLQKLGVNLVGFSKSVPTNPSLFESANVKDGMISIMGDVCDYENLKGVVKKSKPQIIIHMAAQAILRDSYRDPIETYETNVIGTVNLLESIRKIGNRCVVLVVTSDKCYDIKEFSKGFKEHDPMGGYDPYSSSKGCAELVSSSFRNSFFNPLEYKKHGVALATARAGNVIGGGDWGKERLIPDVMRGISSRQTIKIRHPIAIRPWQYVLDPLNGYLLLVEKLWEKGPEFAEAWNFGPMNQENKPVRWIIDKIKEKFCPDIKLEYGENEDLHEEDALYLDCSKAKERLNWETKINLDLALEWTVGWYQKYEQKSDIKKFTENQIDNFSSLL